MSSIVECTHCYTKVLPPLSGECPACGKNTKDISGTDPTRTSLSIGHGEELPPFCCDCGNKTDRFVKVIRSVSQKDGGVDSLRLIYFLLGWFLNVIFFILAARNRSSDVVVVRVPQCRDCRKNGSPKPISVNSEKLRMTILVNRHFKQLVDEGTVPSAPSAAEFDPNPYSPPKSS
jgi:hypothetical protein